MNKKGFTIVELLAVIIILAVIALIASSVVTSIIENSKKGAAERGAEIYLDAVETAVGTERIDGKLLEGTYLINEAGDICPEEEGVNCSEDKQIKIEMIGDKPISGTLKVINGKVVPEDVSLIIKEYEVTYNEKEEKYIARLAGEELEPEPEPEPEIPAICRAVTEDEVTLGNVPKGNYAQGDEYICDPGDGIERTFFVIEDGDNTKLTKDDGTLHYEGDNIGTTGQGEVSLIMNQNIDNTTPSWVSSRSFLESQTIDKGWTVDVSLPTNDQVASANNGSTSNLPQWLYDYLNGTTHPVSNVYGYWTSTANKSHSKYGQYAWAVDSYGWLYHYSIYDYGNFNGVRPVITISKDQLN